VKENDMMATMQTIGTIGDVDGVTETDEAIMLRTLTERFLSHALGLVRDPQLEYNQFVACLHYDSAVANHGGANPE
jgi:hypothetical protein